MEEVQEVRRATLKVVICGEAGVGKTSLVRRVINGEFFVRPSETIGVDYNVWETEVKHVPNLIVKLNIWDLSGQERFRSVVGTHIKGANILLYVFDVSNASTLVALESWMKVAASEERQITCLVATKIDLSEEKRQVTSEAALEYANAHGMRYCETSASTGENVCDPFCSMVDYAHSLGMCSVSGDDFASAAPEDDDDPTHDLVLFSSESRFCSWCYCCSVYNNTRDYQE